MNTETAVYLVMLVALGYVGHLIGRVVGARLLDWWERRHDSTRTVQIPPPTKGWTVVRPAPTTPKPPPSGAPPRQP